MTKNNSGCNDILFKDYADGFFTTKDPRGFRRMNKLKNRHYEESYYEDHQARLDNFIMPRFGTTQLSAITQKKIDEWFVTQRSVGSRRLLSANSRNKILRCLRVILKQAVRDGYLSQDPTKEIATIVENDVGEKEPFSRHELSCLFPSDDRSLVRLWGSLSWATYFLILRDTGWRPAEVAGLKKSSYNRKLNGLYTRSSIVNGTDCNRIKTTGRGQDFKVGIVSERTARFIERLSARMHGAYLFRTVNGNFVCSATANKRLRTVAASIGLNIGSKTQYSFRHSFGTLVADRIPSQDFLLLMSHVGYRHEYDHRTPEMILAQLEPLRGTIEELFCYDK